MNRLLKLTFCSRDLAVVQCYKITMNEWNILYKGDDRYALKAGDKIDDTHKVFEILAILLQKFFRRFDEIRFTKKLIQILCV